MTPASSSLESAEAPLFADGLGARVVAADPTTGELLQILRLRPTLTAVPSFEFALRERTARLMNFRHAYYARVRRIDRVQADGSLAIVSDHVEGTRLSEILRVAHGSGLQLDTNAALCLIRQLVPAVALLHENARDASHGLIAPERIIVTPHARLVLVEHVAGSAIEQLQYTRERLWQELRIAIPASAGPSRFDHRADVSGIGITALSLVLGRPLASDEFPHKLPALLLEARERSALGEERPLSNAFRNWLGRTLQLDVRRAFASAPEALAALEDTLASDPSYLPAPVALETFLSQYIAAVLMPPVHPPASRGAVLAHVATVPAAGSTAGTFVDVPVPGPPPVPPAAFAQPPIVVPPAMPATAAQWPPETPAPAGAAPPPPSSPLRDDPFLPPRLASRDIDPQARLEAVPSIADLIPVGDLRPIAEEPSAPVEDDRRIESARRPEHAALPVRQRAFDPASAFDQPETEEPANEPAAAAPPRRRRSRAFIKLLGAAAAIVVVVAGGMFAGGLYSGTPEPGLGTLVVQSNPPGVEVFVDGVSRGTTPSRISLPAGSHILELRGRGVPRVIPLQVPAGGQISQYLEFADTPVTGMLVVHSQPAGASVTVDGVARGVAPITIEGLEPGDHEVVLQNDSGSSKHIVKVLAGTTASLVAPVTATAAEGPVSGWVSVKAPFVVEMREDGKLLGTSETERLMVAAGRHVLELVNEALGYRELRTLQVQPGKVATVAVELPKGVVHLNAAPWAEVWIDGRHVGETPLGNLEVPIGPHEVVFRHPELGEKRHAISVTTGAPVRLSVSMK